MKPPWLFVLIAFLVLPACATAAAPTPVATGPAMTKAEAIGLVRQYLQSKTYFFLNLSPFSEVRRRVIRRAAMKDGVHSDDVFLVAKNRRPTRIMVYP